MEGGTFFISKKRIWNPQIAPFPVTQSHFFCFPIWRLKHQSRVPPRLSQVHAYRIILCRNINFDAFKMKPFKRHTLHNWRQTTQTKPRTWTKEADPGLNLWTQVLLHFSLKRSINSKNIAFQLSLSFVKFIYILCFLKLSKLPKESQSLRMPYSMTNYILGWKTKHNCILSPSKQKLPSVREI